MSEIGWSFVVRAENGTTQAVYPTVGGTLSQDLSRSVKRNFSGFTFLPSEYAKFSDLARDLLEVTMTVDGVAHAVGSYYASDSSFQPDIVISDQTGEVSDLYHIDFGDVFLLLRRSSEIPNTLRMGGDPSQEMIRLLELANIYHAIANAGAPVVSDITWPPFTPYASILTDLATIARHRSPWADFDGIVRSVAALTVETQIITLESLEPVAGSISITENYLSAANRVAVYDDQADSPTVGIWNAPASAPHSALRRGYVIAVGDARQGLGSLDNALQVAATVGESLTARTLDAAVMPGALPQLDGPIILSYRDALWLCESWSLTTDTGAVLTLSATELVM